MFNLGVEEPIFLIFPSHDGQYTSTPSFLPRVILQEYALALEAERRAYLLVSY